jgi:cellobiose transport system permease protein
VMDEVFYLTIWNTFLIWLMNIFARLGAALFFAYVLSQKAAFRGRNFFMAIFYLPNLITAASIAALFAILLDWQTGPLNFMLLKMGILKEPVYWLNSPFWARFFTAFTIGWTWFGYAMILLIAGMSAIPEDLFESATIDGAGNIQKFFLITIPLIRPTLTYVLITSLIGGLQNFDIPKIITDGFGSPDKSILTTVMYLYNHSFMNFNLGYGAAVSYGLFLVIMLVTVSSFRVLYGSDGAKP